MDKYNEESLSYFKKILKRKLTSADYDEDIINRCYEELNLLYNSKVLFLIRAIYDYLKINKNKTILFKGSANNLLVLYILDVLNFNPFLYDLPSDFIKNIKLKIILINDNNNDFIKFVNDNNEFKITNKIENIYTANDLDFSIYNENTSDEIVNNYDELLENDLEKELCGKLNPVTFNDYIKIKTVCHGADLWNNNQSKLYELDQVNIYNLTSSIEDIYYYLKKHFVKLDDVISIIKILKNGKLTKEDKDWPKYKRLLEQKNCEKIFILILEHSYYVHSKAEIISMCKFKLEREDLC